MAYDGFVTWAMVKELQNTIMLGKIEKVYQPESDELLIHIHSKSGNYKLLASSGSSHARVHYITQNPVNPPAPSGFCMLMRKHLQGGRIIDIQQKDSERIIEISLETLNELGFSVSKKLIIEIMGKHSNIILVDIATGKIIDSIKRVSIDVNRYRQILPGMIYQYPPAQDKVPFKDADEEDVNSLPDDGRTILKAIGGISPAFADEIASHEDKFEYLSAAKSMVTTDSVNPRVYMDANDTPQEFYPVPLTDFVDGCQVKEFDTLSQCLEFYFDRKDSSNRSRQKAHDLIKAVTGALDKMYLKKQRLAEDIL